METDLKVITNNHWHDLLRWDKLTDKERKEHSWCEKNGHDPLDYEFFRYRKYTYCISNFMRITELMPEVFHKWHGYASDSYFSGVLIRYNSEFDAIQCATYY